MPQIVRRLLIFAAVDGLILQPAPPRNHKPTTDQAIKISYKTNAIGPLHNDRRHEDTAKETLEAHGIVGLLKVAQSSFLISISRRDQVALIAGKPVYSISEVALIPLSSKADAEEAIIRARSSQFRHSTTNEDFLSDDSDDEISLADDASVSGERDPVTPFDEHKMRDFKEKTSTVAEDVMSKKGLYGRFTDRWFSKKGWAAENRSRQGLSSQEDLKQVKNVPDDPTVLSGKVDQSAATPEEQPGQIAEDNQIDGQVAPAETAQFVESEENGPRIALLPKLLTTTKIFFGSKNFFFAYDYDLSRNVGEQPRPDSVALHQTFDPTFFWNKHLIQPFYDAGLQDFTVPLIQGFVGQREFSIDSKAENNTVQETSADQRDIQGDVEEATPATAQPESKDTSGSDIKQFLLTVVSRRAIGRAGLRYLRRGADANGQVANSVETEQILCSPSFEGASTPDERLYSYIQYRGSMPLFFSQSPYSLKPIPVFRGSPEENLEAFKSHFKELTERYGRVQVASLVEKKGPESKVGGTFEQLAERSKMFGNDPGSTLKFEWFDFHSVCKGMKFENVSMLFDILGENLSHFGWTTQQGNTVEEKQSGVLRTNCMDCLDRTNVVQSASARIILEKQLATEGIKIDLQHDPTTSWFNTLWADNGDAISRQYAGTAALKGDFTRTRKRNISGALTDFGLTLSRYYNNIVNDYFAQAVIDFLLGRADESILVDFEADMKSQDYAIDLRKVRQNAIETCTTICVDESQRGEHLLNGWALRCPRVSGTTTTHPFEECVLLLTNRSVYFCRIDWSIEKVKAFERIDLEDVRTISRGAYITNTLASRDLDPLKNVGFTFSYTTTVGKDLVRVNTRSLTSNEDDGSKAAQMSGKRKETAAGGAGGELLLLAFKALPPKSSYVDARGGDRDEQPPSEEETTRGICEQIAREVNRARKEAAAAEKGGAAAKGDKSPSEMLEVEEKDVVSLADAKRSTGYLETLGYSLKKLVWAS